MQAKQQPSQRASARNTGGQIICGPDFSVHASEAVSAAGAMATRLRAPLVLVHVLDASAFTEANGKILGQLRKSAQEKLVERFGADLICIGSHVRHGLYKLVHKWRAFL